MADRCQKILVAQLGARRHYAVPVALHQHGRLARLHTDLYAGVPARSLAALLPIGGLRRYGSRYTKNLPPRLICPHRRFGLAYRQAIARASLPSEKTRVWMEYGSRFATLVAAHGFGGADCVYAFSSAGLEVLQAANQRGAVAVLDHATAPRRVEAALLAEEAERFPGWAGAVEDRAVSEAFASRQAAERAAAGLVLCGSSYVQRMVREEDGSDRNTRVVPLGFDPRTAQAEPKRSSGPLRVLFAGSEGLRKGVGYLAEAVGMLPARQVEVRVAGDLGLTPAGLKALAERVQLLGPVVRRDLDDLYRWADVLVLPSLSETFGLVMLEAMAAGLPVVATPNTAAPDVVRDGEDGYIVPVRSPRAIAEKLDLLAGDRVLWREMSASARARAGAFSLEAYGQRLVAALQDGATST